MIHHLPLQGMQVQSLAGELRSQLVQGNWTHMPQLEKQYTEDSARQKKYTHIYFIC